VGHIRDDSNHVVIKTIAIVSVRSMPEGRSHCKGSKRLFECVLVDSVNREVRVITNSGGSMIVSHIRSVVTRLKYLHLLVSK
jgi:hypothetical protein